MDYLAFLMQCFQILNRYKANVPIFELTKALYSTFMELKYYSFSRPNEAAIEEEKNIRVCSLSN